MILKNSVILSFGCVQHCVLSDPAYFLFPPYLSNWDRPYWYNFTQPGLINTHLGLNYPCFHCLMVSPYSIPYVKIVSSPLTLLIGKTLMTQHSDCPISKWHTHSPDFETTINNPSEHHCYWDSLTFIILAFSLFAFLFIFMHCPYC